MHDHRPYTDTERDNPILIHPTMKAPLSSVAAGLLLGAMATAVILVPFGGPRKAAKPGTATVYCDVMGCRVARAVQPGT
jgi:hypothetical protein